MCPKQSEKKRVSLCVRVFSLRRTLQEAKTFQFTPFWNFFRRFSLLKFPRTRDMSESGSGVDSSNEGSAAVLVSEKGRNKRKFLSETSLDTTVEVSTMSLTEFPRYEMLEAKFRNVLNELGSVIQRPEDTVEEQAMEEYHQADWDDPVACQLEELLTNNLFSTFCTAVKKIVECGYTEQVAEWAVLNSSLFHGSKDAVSNVVDGALALLKREKEFNMPKHPIFEGLQSLVDYTLLEMIYVLREVRPDLTIAETMWCLLICDLNLVNACVAEGGPAGASSSKEASGESPTVSQSKSETSITAQSDSTNLAKEKQLMPQDQCSQAKPPVTSPCGALSTFKSSPGKEGFLPLQEAKGNTSGVGEEHIQTSSQENAVDEKSGGGKKGSPSNAKKDMLRQKTFQFEKNYKGRLSKGAFKAKVAAWGSMVLDKSLKSQSGSSSAVMKGAYSKLTTPAGTSSSPVEGNNSVPVSIAKDPAILLPAGISKSHKSSVSHTDPRSKGEINVSDTPKVIDYLASIPFDETLQKYIPRDDREKAILMLVPHKQALEKELQGWTDWANEKVMQAARRLGKDLAELKVLRQEKEEMEKYKKEKQTLEESTMKRLSEMEYALSNATGQMEVANCTIRRLEEENNELMEDLEAAKMKALRSLSDLQEAVRREQEYQKRLQSWEAEKVLILEQMTNVKHQISALNNRVEKAKARQDQFKVLLKQEEKEKVKAMRQIDLLRQKKEEAAASMKAEADNIKRMAEMNMQKCEDDINNLGKMISELRLESDKSKIAALNMGYGGNLQGMQLPKITKRLAVFQDNFGAGDLSPERECVMCMDDEISVVFLPCAHQVLCDSCSALHEKQGMNYCPSCRATIQKRVSVSYRED